jgi:hypothetical protein
MNPANGDVVKILSVDFDGLPEEQKAKIQRDWVRFNIGEVISVKGITFSVHDVSDQRLVLKFVKNQA